MLLRVHWCSSQTMTRIGNWKLEKRNWSPMQAVACHSEGGVCPRHLFFPERKAKSRFLAALGMTFLLCMAVLAEAARGQSLDKPSQTIDEDITAFGFATDGRIAYSARRLYHNKKYDMQRDDIWIQDTGGHRKRIFTGERFTLPAPPVVASEDDDITDERGKKVKKRKEDKPLAPPFTYIVE